MKFKDVAHLYLGCQVTYKRYDEGAEVPRQVARTLNTECLMTLQQLSDWAGVEWHITDIKPVLRRVESLTDEEWDSVEERIDLIQDVCGMGMIKDHFVNTQDSKCRAGNMYAIPATAVLLGMGVDLFQFIEFGEAVEA